MSVKLDASEKRSRGQFRFMTKTKRCLVKWTCGVQAKQLSSFLVYYKFNNILNLAGINAFGLCKKTVDKVFKSDFILKLVTELR